MYHLYGNIDKFRLRKFFGKCFCHICRRKPHHAPYPNQCVYLRYDQDRAVIMSIYYIERKLTQLNNGYIATAEVFYFSRRQRLEEIYTPSR